MSLIELLITIVIVTIALCGAAMPFIAERSFWIAGKSQAEAQRDAQIVMHAISRAARQSTGFSFVTSAGYSSLSFSRDCGTISFEGGPSFNNGQIARQDECISPAQTSVLIDGNRSKVTEFTVTSADTNLVNVRMNVLHKNLRNEVLETQIYLRNAS